MSLCPEVDQILADIGNPQSKTKVLLLGNSGVGKSMLLNVLQRREAFESKFSGTAVTKTVDVEVYQAADDEPAYLLYNIPGLLDPDQKVAAQNAVEIEKAIRDRATTPVIVLFVLTTEGGRLRAEDLEAWRAIAGFAPDINDKTTVAFVVNKLDLGEECPTEKEREEYELVLRRQIRQFCDGPFDIYMLPRLKAADKVFKAPGSPPQQLMHSTIVAAMKKLRGKAIQVSREAHLKLHTQALTEQINKIKGELAATKEDFERQRQQDTAAHKAELEAMHRQAEETAARAREEHEKEMSRLQATVKELEARPDPAIEVASLKDQIQGLQQSLTATQRRSEEAERQMSALVSQMGSMQVSPQAMGYGNSGYAFAEPETHYGSSHRSHHSHSSHRSSEARSSGGSRMTWNQFQHSVGGRGHTKSEISSMYKSYKKRH